ncbi:MAG: AAA family ATPase [Acidimicrobiia bacterium]|nr:AAA family ATPase [Acidimicrobiia bacterium]
MGSSSRAARQRPHLPLPHVRRARLERLLEDDHRRPVTLVSAPAGAGKTTLVSSWVEQRDRPVEWLTVEDRDNEPGGFAEALVGALGSPLIGGNDDIKLLDRTFDELAAQSCSTVLVLDDVDRLAEPGALAVLDHLLRQAPSFLDVVVVSRGDPKLSLGRLRLERRLGEIREPALGFRLLETTALLEGCDLDLRRDDVTLIQSRTGGWAAGIRLFASAIESGLPPARLRDAGPAQAAVEDYLVDEVISRLDDETLEFMSRTCIVHELTTDLAVLLSGRTTAGERLAELHRSELFVTELERSARYRYQELFATVLRARLRQRQPDLARRLHALASRWYALRDLVVEAERHARLAEDWELLATLVERRWVEATVNGARPPDDLLADLPPAVVVGHRPLAVVAAATAYESGQVDDASDQLSTPMLDVIRARACGGDDASLAAADALTDATQPSPRVRRWAELRRAEIELDLGRFADARAALAALADGEGSPIAREAGGLLALVDALDGSLVAARALASGVAGGATEPETGATAAALLALAFCDAQAGHTVSSLPAPDDASVTPSRALRTVAKVASVVTSTSGSHPIVLDRAVAHHPLADRALVALGVLEIQDSAGSLVTVGGPEEALLRAARHVMTSGGSSTSTYSLVAPTLASTSAVHPRTSIDLRVLAALSFSADGTSDLALEHLRGAVGEAVATGVLAPLLDPCPRLVALLGVLTMEASPVQSTVLELLDAIGRVHGPGFVAPLTEQERVVLGFLPTLMSNQEIADAMHLSVNTVKTHVKAVYRKLGVERRRHAVVRARQLELI